MNIKEKQRGMRIPDHSNIGQKGAESPRKPEYMRRRRDILVNTHFRSNMPFE